MILEGTVYDLPRMYHIAHDYLWGFQPKPRVYCVIGHVVQYPAMKNYISDSCWLDRSHELVCFLYFLQ